MLIEMIFLPLFLSGQVTLEGFVIVPKSLSRCCVNIFIHEENMIKAKGREKIAKVLES